MTFDQYMNGTLIALFFLSASFLGATIAIRLDRWHEATKDKRVIRRTFYKAGLPLKEVK